MSAIVAYAYAEGPVVWLTVAAALLAAETIHGRGWAIWGAIGAGVAGVMSLTLKLEPPIAALAFVAATALGVAYALRARALARASRALVE